MDWLKALEPYIPLGIALVFLAIVVIAVTFGRKLNIKLPGGLGVEAGERETSTTIATEAVANVVEHMQIRLDQYGEVATALTAVLEAGPLEVDAAAREWFTTLATRLAHLLREQGDHHYRVAIWLDGDDPTSFHGVGYGYFQRTDDNMDRLERDYTIGGLAFRSRTGDYYCRDTTADHNFHPRKTVPPSFHSVYGIALGSLQDPWGVMTVDARQTHGFSDDRRLLIRRFADLASLGAVVWASRLAATPATDP